MTAKPAGQKTNTKLGAQLDTLLGMRFLITVRRQPFGIPLCPKTGLFVEVLQRNTFKRVKVSQIVAVPFFIIEGTDKRFPETLVGLRCLTAAAVSKCHVVIKIGFLAAQALCL